MFCLLLALNALSGMS